MDTENLVRMANQIGSFFEAMPDRDEALEGVSNHIRKFWALRMRKQLAEYRERDDGTGLMPIVVDALTLHPIMTPPPPLDPPEPRSAAEKHDWNGASES